MKIEKNKDLLSNCVNAGNGKIVPDTGTVK